MEGNFFQRIQQSSTEAISSGFNSHKHPLYLGMSGSDHQECNRSEKLSVTTRRKKNSMVCPKNICRDQMITFSWVQCPEVVV